MENKRLEHLDALFNPGTIAFIGASEETNKWGFIVFNSILRGGWPGRIFPVNPGRESILGIKAYDSVTDIPEAIDLAVMTVPAKYVPMVIDDCLSMNVKAGLIISAGFREMGGEQKQIEAPPKPTRSALRELVNKYAHEKTKDNYSEAWRDLYTEIYYRLHINVTTRAKNEGIKAIDYLDREGMISDAMAIMRELLRG